MGLRGRKIADTFFGPSAERASRRAARRIADAVGEEMTDATRRHTPVDRGDLLASIEQTPTRRTRDGYSSGAQTDHDEAPFAEWDTSPHWIEPEAGDGALLMPDGQHAAKVFHPGTQGHHMFARGAAEADRKIEQIAQPILEQLKQEQER